MNLELEKRLKQYWLNHNKDSNSLDEYIMKSDFHGGLSMDDFYSLGDYDYDAEKLASKWEDEEIAEAIAQTNVANSCSSGDCTNGNFEWKDEDQEDIIFVETPDNSGKFNVLLFPAGTSDDNKIETILSSDGGVDYGIDEWKLEEPKHKGLRYNTGKIRYDLVHPWAHEQMVKVLTKGAEKYAERNWERGMAWSNVLASLERHLQAVKKGEDYDPETGLLHAAHIACNAHFLTAYYKIYPQGDDRPHSYLRPLKIGLDIDDVLADFVSKWRERYPNNEVNFWNFDKDMKEKFAEVANDKDFWMTMKPKIKPEDLPFEPTCYITSRMIPNEWTEEWLQVNGFPAVPVHTIGFNESKVEVAKESGIEIFVDDRYENFVELNNAGIATFLMDAKHNQRYDVGFKRIHSLKDLM